jgi:signal transduction histidine kinase
MSAVRAGAGTNRELSLSLDDLRTAQDRLVQTEKLASLGQLTAGIAHEIKNPLNFVNNFSALSAELIDELNDVLKPAALDDKTREEIDELTHMLKGNLEKVVQHGKRADSIVKNMLLHSREGSGEHRPADINAIVEESLNLAYHGARAEKSGFNITLQRDLDPKAGMIDLYPQEITRVFLNLISNGFYAATKRKEAGDEAFEPTLSATTKSLGNKVEIRIRDNGTGIPLGSEGEDVQSLLHHQAGRRGHRTWPVDEPRHRGETTWRQDRRRYRAGRIYRIHYYAAATAAAAQSGWRQN